MRHIKNLNENCVIIDWFSASTNAYEPSALIEYLGLDIKSFIHTYGRYFYADRLTYGGISVYYNLRSNDTENGSVLLEMSGQGCRQFETSSEMGFMQLFCDVSNGELKVTRLDVAYDDIDHEGNGLLDINKLTRYTIKQRFVTKWSSGKVIDKFKTNGNYEPMTHALTVQFGSKKSKALLRIYDKAQERGGFDYHWIRAEMQFNGDRAAGFINKLLETKCNVGKLYAGVLKNYLRFIKPDHTRRERCSTVGWWEQFLDNAEKVKIFTPKTIDYDLARVRNYVINQSGNCIDTYITCVGTERFFSELKERKSQLNEKQIKIIREYHEGHKGSGSP